MRGYRESPSVEVNAFTRVRALNGWNAQNMPTQTKDQALFAGATGLCSSRRREAGMKCPARAGPERGALDRPPKIVIAASWSNRNNSSDALNLSRSMDTIERIRSAANDARHRGEHPTKVFLTVDDGRKLQFELISKDPRLGHRIEKEGVRHALRKIEGLEVVWRSPEFKVS
jgi:hypothetical protein